MTLQLTAADSAGSSLLALSGGTVQPFSYSPFGATASRTGASAASVPGFNGERADPLTGVTHLGNGYRAYSPALRRFTAPDSESPFGVGGINPYAYCSNDPVNQRDPSGHGPLMKLIEGILWGAEKLSKKLALSPEAEKAVSSAVAQTESVILGVSAAGSLATGIASAATSNSNPEVSAKLGWASLGLGITVAAFGIPEVGSRIKSKLKPAKKRIIKLNDGELRYRVFGYNLPKVTDTTNTAISNKAISEIFYIKNFNAEHHDLIMTHMSKDHWFMVFKAPGIKYWEPTVEDFVQYFKLSGIDLSSRDTPLHLVACFSGSPEGLGGIGDRLANLLGRLVITYGNNEVTYAEGLTATQILESGKMPIIYKKKNKIVRRARVNYHYPSAEV